MHANRHIVCANFFGSPSDSRAASSPGYRFRILFDARSGSLYAGWTASTMVLHGAFVRKRAGWIMDI